MGSPRSSPETRIWVQIGKWSQKLLEVEKWEREGKKPIVCPRVALSVGNWGSVSMETWETESSQVRGRKLGYQSTTSPSFFGWGLLPGALSLQHLTLSCVKAEHLQQSSVCQVTAEDDGRAPKETATVCFYKWGTSLTLSLNLTKTLTCNSELKITGFSDNARDGYYEMNKKMDWVSY